jgi:hypothetical protein
MSFDQILSVAGKPGLFRIVSQSKTTIIVESLIDKKRIPVDIRKQISSLKDIAMYTYTKEVPLEDVMRMMKKSFEGKVFETAGRSAQEIRAAVTSVLPELNQEKVYDSDLKKLVQWYNLLVQNELISDEAEEAGEESTEDAENA